MGPIDTRFGSHVREWGEDVETKMVHYRIYMHCDVIGVFIPFHVFLLTLVHPESCCHQNGCFVLINFAHSFLEDLKFYPVGTYY